MNVPYAYRRHHFHPVIHHREPSVPQATVGDQLFNGSYVTDGWNHKSLRLETCYFFSDVELNACGMEFFRPINYPCISMSPSNSSSVSAGEGLYSNDHVHPDVFICKTDFSTKLVLIMNRSAKVLSILYFEYPYRML